MNRLVIKPKKDLVFDLKVREMCRSCKRYSKKATCPPYVGSFEYYSKLLPQYTFGSFYFEKFVIEGNYLELGKESSLKIYRKILLEREKLFKDGHYFIIGFGAGSCKLCNECSFPCPIPEKALIPLEATGINIVKILGRYGVTLEFPVKKYFYRVGAIFYD